MPDRWGRQLSRTNRAAVLHGPGDLRLEDVAVPVPAPDEVLVEIRAVGVCGSDTHYYREGRVGSHVVRAPLILGHETAGVVVERGSAARRHEPGTRVALEPGVPDRRCRQCLSGHYNLCPNVRFFATPPVDGTFCRYQVIHEDFAYPLPDHLSDEAGALAEPLSVGLWATRRAGVGPGDHVLVTGAGPVGLLMVQVARIRGATAVTVTDVADDRLAVAADLGATTTLRAAEADLRGLDADVLLECSGVPAVLADALLALRPAGTAVAVGMGGDGTASLPVWRLQERELWLTGSFRYANTYPQAIALLAEERVRTDRLITHRFGLDEAEAALRAVDEDPGALKPMVLPAHGRT